MKKTNTKRFLLRNWLVSFSMVLAGLPACAMQPEAEDSEGKKKTDSWSSWYWGGAAATAVTSALAGIVALRNHFTWQRQDGANQPSDHASASSFPTTNPDDHSGESDSPTLRPGGYSFGLPLAQPEQRLNDILNSYLETVGREGLEAEQAGLEREEQFNRVSLERDEQVERRYINLLLLEKIEIEGERRQQELLEAQQHRRAELHRERETRILQKEERLNSRNQEKRQRKDLERQEQVKRQAMLERINGFLGGLGGQAQEEGEAVQGIPLAPLAAGPENMQERREILGGWIAYFQDWLAKYIQDHGLRVEIEGWAGRGVPTSRDILMAFLDKKLKVYKDDKLVERVIPGVTNIQDLVEKINEMQRRQDAGETFTERDLLNEWYNRTYAFERREQIWRDLENARREFEGRQQEWDVLRAQIWEGEPAVLEQIWEAVIRVSKQPNQQLDAIEAELQRIRREKGWAEDSSVFKVIQRLCHQRAGAIKKGRRLRNLIIKQVKAFLDDSESSQCKRGDSLFFCNPTRVECSGDGNVVSNYKSLLRAIVNNDLTEVDRTMRLNVIGKNTTMDQGDGPHIVYGPFSPLVFALAMGNMEMVNKLVEYGYYVNYGNNFFEEGPVGLAWIGVTTCQTLIGLAVNFADLEMVNWLVQKGADLQPIKNRCTDYNPTLRLHTLCSMTPQDIKADWLVAEEKMYPNTAYVSIGARNNDLAMILFLLKKGAPALGLLKQSNSGAQHLVKTDFEVVNEVIHAIVAAIPELITTQQIVIDSQQTKYLELNNIKSFSGLHFTWDSYFKKPTFLGLAAYNGRLDIVFLLLRAGADATRKSTLMSTKRSVEYDDPSDASSRAGDVFEKIELTFYDPTIPAKILETEGYPLTQDELGQRKGRLFTLAEALERGCQFTPLEQEKQVSVTFTPAEIVARQGRPVTLDEIVKRGGCPLTPAEIEKRRSQSSGHPMTPAELAEREGHILIAQLLRDAETE